MYHFNHYYKKLDTNSEFSIKKSLCEKVNIFDDIMSICNAIDMTIPEFDITIQYGESESLYRENEDIKQAKIIIDIKGLPSFCIDFFADSDRTYYVALRKIKFTHLFMAATYFKCHGSTGLKKLIEHYLGWGELFVSLFWKRPLDFRYEDIEQIKIFNPQYTIKQYHRMMHNLVCDEFSFFEFNNANSFHCVPMIGMSKGRKNEFIVISTNMKNYIKGSYDFTENVFFYVFKTIHEGTYKEKTSVFCCNGVVGLTDFLNEYPKCENIGDTYRYAKTYPFKTT